MGKNLLGTYMDKIDSGHQTENVKRIAKRVKAILDAEKIDYSNWKFEDFKKYMYQAQKDLKIPDEAKLSIAQARVIPTIIKSAKYGVKIDG